MPATTPPPDDPFPEQGDFGARRDFFEQLIEGRAREDCILIAARAALRGVPKTVYNKEMKEDAQRIVLTLLRCHILNLVFSLMSSAERDALKAVTNAAADAAANYANHSYPAAYIAYVVTRSANNNVRSFYSTALTLTYASKDPHYTGGLFESDLARVDGSHQARERLAASPLWLNAARPPVGILSIWDTFSTQLRALGDDWDVWAQWYGGGTHEGKTFPGVLQGASNGRYLFGLPTARALKLWHDVALLPNALWQGEPAILNAEFKRLVEEAREVKTPYIPTPKPSALEPIWEDGRLILPAVPAPLDGSGENVLAALHALKEDFAELVEDAKGEANIDSRAIAYLSRLAERIPRQAPTNLELHRIAQNESALQGYGKTVTDEWPNFLAVRYHALTLQFTRAMAQFPNWREFKRIAMQSDLNEKQVEQAPETAKEFAEELKDEAFEDFVDPDISEKLNAFADFAESGEGEAVIIGKDMLAVDLLNSVETILIRLAEAALASAKGTGKLAGEAWNAFAKNAKKSFVEQASKAGKAVGQAIAKWLKRGFYGGVAYMGAPVAIAKATAFLTKLIATYPAQFGWLEAIIKLLG